MNKQWGVGNAKDSKAFDQVHVQREIVDLIFGEHPHSRRDNNIYARFKNGDITGFDGHRLPFKIEIEESNYLKDSHYSGSEIRKSCSVKLFLNGIQILDEFCRNHEAGFRIVQNFIIEMENHWSWFPKNTDEVVGKVVGYCEQIFKIKRVVVSQSALILETIDGEARKKFLWEDESDFEKETTVKVEIISKNLTWYPKYPGSAHNED